MDEESMWKQFYEKVKEQQDSTKTMDVLDVRVQELDGGFFEKFGTLLKEQAEEQELREKSPEIIEDANGEAEGVEGEGGGEGEGEGDAEGENGVAHEDGETLPVPEDSDSEPELADKTDLISVAMGWNIEELYLEVLYEILHIVGCDASAAEERAALFTYLQEAFKLDDDRHNELLERAKAKEAPNILLNVEVIEAKELKSKDANGLSDPFCTLYLTSANTHRYNTSVKSGTLCPTWEEHFSLDFDPAETVREKMMKIGGVKGVKGLRKLMKEIAVTASTGKHDNEFVGSALLPLRNIPAPGQTVWCTLERKGKAKKQGLVKLKLAFSSEKNSQVAFQEHRHLLRLLLLHHLETSKVEPYHWQGNFSSAAQTILTQHLVQCGLSQTEIILAKWVEYSSVHLDHHLSFKVFPILLENLLKPLNNKLLCDENEKLFWESTKKLMPSCLNAIRKIRKLTPSDKNTINQLTSLLSVLSKLRCLTPPEDFELFPTALYDHIIENNIISDSESSEETRLNHLIKIVQLVRADLQKATEFHDKIFQESMQIPYAQILYSIYEAKVSELVEPVVEDVCRSLKPLKFTSEIPPEVNENDPLTMGTKLFELYLILQRFSVLGTGLSPSDTTKYKITEFHRWFHRGVAQWLDIALWKALQRINKAVELDELVPVSSSVKYSSSAVDTLAIFYQIKIFWQQLSWPDVEGSYTFVAKIIDDICRCSVFYADKMSERVEGLGESENVFEKRFEVTKEWCLAINNIDYVRQSILPFVGELGMDDIVNELANFRSSTAAEHCRQTLQLVIDNTVETVGNKIVDLLETVAQKILVGFFRQGEEHSSACNTEALHEIEDLLSLHSMETWQLIHRFHLERLAEQKAMETACWGLITIKAQFVEDLLRIQILNARNLHPKDSNGSCDPYVKVYLLPTEKFIGAPKPRTKTHKKNLFPLFDETFTLALTNNQRQVEDGMILFTIKDQDFLGNEFVAEAYIPFADIPQTEMTTGLEELEQIHLKLNKPKNLNSRISKALDHRQGDRLAKDFMKKQRSKVSH
ncbi:Synaptotagmin 1 [Gryllus bimaculatus]|nr:Synaptotagmin 1 [Gryllus bimaculatus]